MHVFAVLSAVPNPALGSKIAETYPDNHLQVSPSQWLVAANKVTTEVSTSLGILEGTFGNVMVLKIDNYYGWHSKGVWEWLQLKAAAA
jgi:hypothetical protein